MAYAHSILVYIYSNDFIMVAHKFISKIFTIFLISLNEF